MWDTIRQCHQWYYCHFTYPSHHYQTTSHQTSHHYHYDLLVQLYILYFICFLSLVSLKISYITCIASILNCSSEFVRVWAVNFPNTTFYFFLWKRKKIIKKKKLRVSGSCRKVRKKVLSQFSVVVNRWSWDGIIWRHYTEVQSMWEDSVFGGWAHCWQQDLSQILFQMLSLQGYP